jgi:hypothetical protein
MWSKSAGIWCLPGIMPHRVDIHLPVPARSLQVFVISVLRILHKNGCSRSDFYGLRVNVYLVPPTKAILVGQSAQLTNTNTIPDAQMTCLIRCHPSLLCGASHNG